MFLVLRDIFPQWTVDAGVFHEGNPILGFLRKKERLLYAACDEEQIASGKLDNLILCPGVDPRTYLGVLREFDIGLITLDRRLKQQNFPGKLLGYLAVSMPVLASVNPGNDLRDILEQHEAGLVCENGEDETLLKNALRLVRDPELRQRLGRNGRQLLESVFSVSHAADRILRHFRS